MTEVNRNVDLNVDGRHRDVQIDIEGRGHGSITFSIEGGGARKPPYEGPYTVTSEVDMFQFLPTKDRILTEDIIVFPIPYIETSNPKGGLTVYIGGN